MKSPKEALIKWSQKTARLGNCLAFAKRRDVLSLTGSI
jgi:hypothetical protein